MSAGDRLKDAGALLHREQAVVFGEDSGDEEERLDLAEIPAPVADQCGSWARILAATTGDPRSNFEQACVELFGLARTYDGDDHVRQAVGDALFEMARKSGIADDEAQGIMSARLAPNANGYDPNDWAEEHTTEQHKFPLLAFDQIHVDTKRRGYLVKGLIASTGLTVVWGPPKCGKSFWAVDVGMHVALGWEYRGRRVQQAPVVYIALEGQHGLPARIEAFRRHHGVTEAPFYLVLVRLDLIADHTALVSDIKSQIGAAMPGAVFIDTLNRSLVGSESKDEDMGRYLAAAEYVATTLACAVIVVHHCGIDATRPRGHTSLTGSVESQLAVKRSDTGEVVVTVEYAKDMPEGTEVYSTLEPVTVGADPDGDAITSLVVMPATSAGRTERKPVKGAKAVALELLRKAIAEAGSVPAVSNHIPANTRTISLESFRTYAYAGSITESDEPDSKRKAFVRALKDLQEAHLVAKWGEHLWLL